MQHQEWWSKSGYGLFPSDRAGVAVLPLNSLFVREVAKTITSGCWVA